MKKVLAVISTYNPEDQKYNSSFEDFSHMWFETIRSWEMQKSDDLQVDIVVADNVSGPKTRAKLLEFQKQKKDFYIDFVDERFSSPAINSNHALSLFKDKPYDYYAFCPSDACFLNKGDLKILLDDIDDNCSHITPQADNDWVPRFIFDKTKAPTRTRLGEVVNTHIGIWTREFMEAYDYKRVDILGGPRSEGFYPYLCAAIKKQEYVSHRVCIHHAGAHDRLKLEIQPLVAPHYKRDFYKMLEQGMRLGLGFEECLANPSIYWNTFLNKPKLPYLETIIIKTIALNPVSMAVVNFLDKIKIVPPKIDHLIDRATDRKVYRKHNPDCFDANGYPKTDELLHFMKENLFLKRNELDYGKIPFQFYKPD